MNVNRLFKGFAPREATHLLAPVNAAAERLERKLARLDLDRLPLSTPSRRLLADKLGNVRATLQVSTFLLVHALAGTGRPMDETVLCDYGGGTGLFSFLALEAGAVDVLYVDIVPAKHSDALVLGEALGHPLRHAVLGDVDDAVRRARRLPAPPRCVCSFDVLEHIHDLDAHFAALSGISEGPLDYVMASTANDANPLVRWRLMRMQREAELTGSGEAPYLEQRWEMVEKHLERTGTTLDEATARALAAATRGRERKGVEQAVDAMLATGRLPSAPPHPTNTCNPQTGSWLEHLFDPRRLTRLLAGQGFEARIVPGLYGDSPSAPRDRIVGGVNRAISLLGPLGLRLAPFYCLLASRR